MNELKLGSLFDGSGGFPLAGAKCGIKPVWASEIEPYPVAVTCSRFPNMKHYGDVSKVCGANVEPVDIITFGSPCQDLSVAGKRAGLKHEENGDDETTRSGLFMEAVRIIKEMREATNGEYPTFAIWENVPGAFSSNKGEDFRTVLEEIIKVNEPSAVMPSVPKGGWAYADSYMGDGWSVAYRVLDAQFWGVPQRRKRIYLVADFRGQRAEQVLFERKGLRGYFAEGRTSWQATAGDAENCTGTADREGTIPCTLKIRSGCEGGGKGALVQVDKSATLATNNDQYLFQPVYGIDHAITTGGNCTAQGPCVHEDIQATLKASGVHGVAYAMQAFGDYKESEVGSSLKARDYKDATDLVADAQPIAIERAYFNQGQNALYAPTITEDGTNPTLVARGPNAVCVRYIVRRLTPTECARLQGFPDLWGHPDKKSDFTEGEYNFWLDVRNTHASINGKTVKEYTKNQMLTWYNKLHTDSAEYKMWGNGIALPCALYVMEGIAEVI